MLVAMDSNIKSETVYVRLLDEGTDVMRPVTAEKVSADKFRLIKPSNYDPTDEKWEFAPETNVRCVAWRVDGQVILVAESKADE